MCSTPQKHPAATVAFCAFAGKFCAPVSCVRRIVLENGRTRREKNDGIMAMSIAETAMRSGAERFSLTTEKRIVSFEESTVVIGLDIEEAKRQRTDNIYLR